MKDNVVDFMLNSGSTVGRHKKRRQARRVKGLDHLWITSRMSTVLWFSEGQCAILSGVRQF